MGQAWDESDHGVLLCLQKNSNRAGSGRKEMSFMSRMRKIKIKCPKCGMKSPFMLWESINTVLNTQMKAAVRDGSVFCFECPKCGHKVNVNYEMVYHQMEDQIMICCVFDNTAGLATRLFSSGDEDIAFMDLKLEGYIHRIVTNQKELIEKLAIFDAGLDDRIIELYKIKVLEKVSSNCPELKDTNAFFIRENETNKIVVTSSKGDLYKSKLRTDLYENLVWNYGNRLGEIRGSGPVVNRAWAEELV